MEAQSLNHWTAREVPFLKKKSGPSLLRGEGKRGSSSSFESSWWGEKFPWFHWQVSLPTFRFPCPPPWAPVLSWPPSWRRRVRTRCASFTGLSAQDRRASGLSPEACRCSEAGTGSGARAARSPRPALSWPGRVPGWPGLCDRKPPASPRLPPVPAGCSAVACPQSGRRCQLRSHVS